MPTLARFANTSSPYQGRAASLAVEAEIMQIQLATRNMQFREREGHCDEAVRYGGISRNARLYTTALHWQGNTYVYCYHEPQIAIPILNNALLSSLDNEMLLAKKDFKSSLVKKDIQQRERILLYPPSLSRSGICSLLSIAYAQEGDEVMAREYAEMARLTMPNYPKLDPFYRCIQFGLSELDQQEGKMNFHLAEYFPDSNHAQLAYDAFNDSISKQAMNQGYLSGSIIKKADALRALGDMRECVTCLTKGFDIGDKIGSLRRLSEADDVVSNMPPEWQQETDVRDLQKDITHAIVVVRRQFC